MSELEEIEFDKDAEENKDWVDLMMATGDLNELIVKLFNKSTEMFHENICLANELTIAHDNISKRWNDVKSIEQIQSLSAGAYELLFDTGTCVLGVKGLTDIDKTEWILSGQVSADGDFVRSWKDDDDFIFGRVKKYRLLRVYEWKRKESGVARETD